MPGKKRSSEAKGSDRKRSGDAGGGHMAGLMGFGLYGGAGANGGPRN